MNVSTLMACFLDTFYEAPNTLVDDFSRAKDTSCLYIKRLDKTIASSSPTWVCLKAVAY